MALWAPEGSIYKAILCIVALAFNSWGIRGVTSRAGLLPRWGADSFGHESCVSISVMGGEG